MFHISPGAPGPISFADRSRAVSGWQCERAILPLRDAAKAQQVIMLSERAKRVETLRLIFKVFAVLGIGGLLSAIIFFFAAYTGQFIPNANVEWVWRSFQISIITTGVCGLAALGFSISHRQARKALERYSETHCAECGHDLALLIHEKKEQRKRDRSRGTAVHESLYFDVYCPNCKCQRTARE